MSDDELEAAVAAYRAELCAEAELARGDLDEIEDHLRALVDELRADGRGDVIGEARRRLGDPRAVAREHARVRTPFGARPSRAQAWSAALVLAPLLAWQTSVAIDRVGLWSRAGLELAIAVVLMAGLITRQAWSRAILFGHTAAMTIPSALILWAMPDSRVALLGLISCAGTALFLMPRRRGDLAPAGVGLALLAPAYSAAAVALALQITRPGGTIVGDPIAMTALFATMIAGAGVMLRARWGSLAAAVAALALASATYTIHGLTWRLEHAELRHALLVGMMLAGTAAAAIAAVVTWRSGRNRLGTLRGLVTRS